MSEHWSDACMRVIGSIASPDVLSRGTAKPLRVEKPIFVVCSVSNGRPRAPVRRRETACMQAAMETLHAAGFALTAEDEGCHLWIRVELAESPSREFCVFSLRAELMQVARSSGPAQTTHFKRLWRGTPLCATTRKPFLTRDLKRLTQVHVQELTGPPSPLDIPHETVYNCTRSCVTVIDRKEQR